MNSFLVFIIIFTNFSMSVLAQEKEILFPLMTDSITCSKIFDGDKTKDIVWRSLGKDTCLISGGVGDIKTEIKDSITKIHIRLLQHKWFSDSILLEGLRNKCYKTLFLTFQPKYKDTIFIRSVSNAVLFIGTSSCDTLGHDQILFYYNAQINNDVWMVENFPFRKRKYQASLAKKGYNFGIRDSVYAFLFMETYSSDPFCVWFYVSKKYGILAIEDNRYRYSYRETWYYPFE